MKKKTNKVSLMDVKHALLDERFRETLPEELSDEVQRFLNNPGCSCNHPIYRSVIKKASAQLSKYFPAKTPVNPDEEIQQLSKNEWSVINCHVNELIHHLRKLPPGRKQLDIARYDDQITIVINELDLVY